MSNLNQLPEGEDILNNLSPPKKRKQPFPNHQKFLIIGITIILSCSISALIVKTLIVTLSLAANSLPRPRQDNSVRSLTKKLLQLKPELNWERFVKANLRSYPVLFLSANDETRRFQALQALSQNYCNESITWSTTSTYFLGEYELLEIEKDTITAAPKSDNVQPHVKLQKFFSQLLKSATRRQSEDKEELPATTTLTEFRSGSNIGTGIPNDSFIFDRNALESMPLISEILLEPLQSLRNNTTSSSRNKLSLDDRLSQRQKNHNDEGHGIKVDSNELANQHLFDSFAGSTALSIDRSESGLPFHQGPHCWVDLISGVRRWVIYPPGRIPNSGFSPVDPLAVWLRESYPGHAGTRSASSLMADDEMPLEVLQLPGQVLYIPEGWYRASVTTSSEESIALYQCATQLDAGSFYEYLQEGWKQLRQTTSGPGENSDNYDAARKLFQLALKKHIDDPFIHHSIGLASELLGDYALAEASYLISIDGNKLDPRPYERLIRLILRQRQRQRRHRNSTESSSPSSATDRSEKGRKDIGEGGGEGEVIINTSDSIGVEEEGDSEEENSTTPETSKESSPPLMTQHHARTSSNSKRQKNGVAQITSDIAADGGSSTPARSTTTTLSTPPAATDNRGQETLRIILTDDELDSIALNRARRIYELAESRGVHSEQMKGIQRTLYPTP